MARKAINKDILRNLALKSKNQCAFPECTSELITDDNVFIGQVCHIEAAEKGGERYNPKQTDEERRSIANLILFCYKHHKITNDVKKYPPDELMKIKKEHESNNINVFDQDKIVQAIENLENAQSKLFSKVQGFINQKIQEENGYKISSPGKDEVWLPEKNKLYKDEFSDGTYFEYMMKGELLCISQGFPDGAEAYYEITEDGSVKESKMPYPLEEYRVEIPDEMLVRTEVVKLPGGITKEKHILKYNRHVTLLKGPNGKLLEADLQARLRVSHKDRLFKILGPSDT